MQWVSIMKGMQQMNKNEYEALVEWSWQQEYWRTWRGEEDSASNTLTTTKGTKPYSRVGVRRTNMKTPTSHTLHLGNKRTAQDQEKTDI